MSTELMIPSADSKYATPDVIRDLSTVGRWLPRIEVGGSSKEYVKSGKVPVGQFVLVNGKNLTALGSSIVVISLSWRPKALRFGELAEAYDPNSETYKEIRIAADRGGQNNPNTYGPEFLHWVVDHNVLATFYHGNISQRTEAAIAIELFNKQKETQGSILPLEYKMDFVKSKQPPHNSWHIGRASAYESDVPASKLWKQEDMEMIKSELAKFNDPKERKPSGEKAESDSADSAGRER